jgi:hypothetical protein
MPRTTPSGCRQDTMSKPLPNHVGLVAYRKAQSTGTHVGLYRSLEAGIESDPELPWATVLRRARRSLVPRHT